MLNKVLPRILLYLNVMMFSGTAIAAGSGDHHGTTSKMPSSYAEALDIIKERKCQEAIPLLKLADRKRQKHADIIYLLGFVHRKTGDLDKAGAYYREALKIDGEHKGALEYRGKLFPMVGNKAAAKDNLRKLDKICSLDCRELDDHRAIIANYKS